MIKRFIEWFDTKEKIDLKEHLPPLFNEGEIWWCYIGENVGIEINGKSEAFTRPVCILKKYDRYSFLGLPLSTKVKRGSWYVSIHFKDLEQMVVLVQGRTFDYRRLKEKIGELTVTDMKNIRKGYANLHL